MTEQSDYDARYREWAAQMSKLEAENEQLRSRVSELTDHLDWLGWGTGEVNSCKAKLVEELDAAKAEIERLRILCQDLVGEEQLWQAGKYETEMAKLSKEIERLLAEIERLRADVQILTKSRDHYMEQLNAEIERLRAERDRWKALVETRQVSFCVHCGTKFQMGPEGVAEFKLHIAECNNHPLQPLAKERDEAREVARHFASMSEVWSQDLEEHPWLEETDD